MPKQDEVHHHADSAYDMLLTYNNTDHTAKLTDELLPSIW